MANIIALVKFILPLASGLFILIGCDLSFSMSLMSFKIYPADANNENEKKPIIILGKDIKSNFNDKRSGKKIIKFLIQ